MERRESEVASMLVLAWLGVHRDALPPQAVRELQEVADQIRRLPDANADTNPTVRDRTERDE